VASLLVGIGAASAPADAAPGARRDAPPARGKARGAKANLRDAAGAKAVKRGAKDANKTLRRARKGVRRAILAPAGEKARLHGPAQVAQKAGKLGLAGATEKRGTKRTSWLSLITFFLLAFGCAGFSVVMITRKSPMMSAMSLLVVFLCLAGIYVFLAAPFMAAIQLIVYAGAIIVLFVFVIMSMGLKAAYGAGRMGKDLSLFLGGFLLSGAAAIIFFYGHGVSAYLVSGLLVLGTLGLFLFGAVTYPVARFLGVTGAALAGAQVFRLASLTRTYLNAPPKGEEDLAPMALARPISDDFGGAQAVGRSLFQDNAFTFEALSLLLLAAIVAAVVVVRSRKEKEASES
jgi:NADH-quinone oxidoreductase subunit J